MPFPNSPRVIYSKNPLVEVICQLRFPSILRIDSEVPSKFQEKIRHQYPLFEETPIKELKLELPPELIQAFKEVISPVKTGKIAYDFLSPDKTWKVGLTREFIALSTNKYERWEEFKAYLEEPLSALINVYSPAFFTRVGLRYRDVICRSALGLPTDYPWSELLKPHIAGELTSPTLADCVFGVAKKIQVRLSENAEVLIQHGFVQHPEGETCYLIDSDFSISAQTEVTDVIPTLDLFNRQTRDFFRWCITDQLHRAMEPRPIETLTSNNQH